MVLSAPEGASFSELTAIESVPGVVLKPSERVYVTTPVPLKFAAGV